MALTPYYRPHEAQPQELAPPDTRGPYWRDGSIIITGPRLQSALGQSAAISGSPATGVTRHGRGPVIASGVVPTVTVSDAPLLTILIALRPAAVNTYGRVFSRSDTLVSMFGNISAGGIDLSVPHSGATGWWDINSGGFVANGDYVIAISYDGTSTANDPVASVNGRRVSVSRFTAPSGTRTSYAGALALGNRASDGARQMGGALPLFAWLPGVFEQDALNDLTANPWQLYEPQRIWVPVSAGTGPQTYAATLSAAVSAGAAIQRAAYSSRMAVLSVSAARAAQVSVTRSAVAGAIADLSRTARIMRAATVTCAAALSTIEAKLLTLTAAVTTSATLRRATQAVRAASSTAAASVSRAVSATRSAAITASASVTRAVAITRSAATSIGAAVATIKAKLLTLAASVATSATVRRAVAITRAASTAPAAAVSRLVRKTFTAAQGLLAFLATLGGGGGGPADVFGDPGRIRLGAASVTAAVRRVGAYMASSIRRRIGGGSP